MEVQRSWKMLYAAGFEDGGRGHELRNASLENGRGKEMDSPLETLVGTWPSPHFGLGPMKLIACRLLASRNERE